MLEEAFYQHMTANPRRSRTRATRGRTGWTDATASHHLPRSQPASGLRRQPELCQQAAEVTAQNGVAVGMVSGCGQTTRTTVNSSTCLASPICHGTRTCLHNVSMVSLMCSGSVGHASMIVPIRARSCSSVSCDCSHSAATREGWWHNSLSPQLVVSSETRVRFPRLSQPDVVGLPLKCRNPPRRNCSVEYDFKFG